MDAKSNEALYMLMAIVDRGKRRVVRRVLAFYGADFTMNLMGKGTARSDLLTYLGIGDRERDLVIAFVLNSTKNSVLASLSADLKLEKRGNGILFTVPMASVGGRRTLEILQSERRELLEKEERGMQKEQAQLIITIVQRGYSHDVVDAAMQAGAQGATVLHGRASSAGHVRRFYGIMVEPQKDVVLMLVRTEIVVEVMRAICDKAGLKTAGQGISFSLPVTDVIGALGFEDAPFASGVQG